MLEIYTHINWDPDRKGLRHFSWAAAGALAVIGAVFAFRADAITAPSLSLWAVAGAVVLSGAAVPEWLRPVYRVWMAITAPLAFGMQVLLLCVFFYLILTPVALVMRCLGRDPLHRRFRTDDAGFWVSHASPADLRRYFRQY